MRSDVAVCQLKNEDDLTPEAVRGMKLTSNMTIYKAATGHGHKSYSKTP